MRQPTSALRARLAIALGAVIAAVAGLLPVPGLASLSPAAADPEGGVRTVEIEVINDQHIVLGDLASRSQQKPVNISGIGPYVVSGTDSRTGEPYSFVTDFNYTPTNPGWQRESGERALSSFTHSTNRNSTWGGRDDVLRLFSGGNCQGGNLFDGFTAYCSAFGPEAWSAPFEATEGEAVSFDWAASGGGDDYEIYAYLVEVQPDEDEDSGFDFGTEDSHTLLVYGRGDTQGWTTASGPVPRDGTYRFRFVNGTYDKTGGLAIGAELFVDNTIVVGLDNPIAFPPLSDRVYDADDATFSLTASAPADGDIVFSSLTPDACTVDGDEVTLTGEAFGVCTILAEHPGDDTHVPAAGIAQSFLVLEEPTAPTNNGLPLISGEVEDGETVTASEGSWGDGGSPITSTSFQWFHDSGDGEEAIAGANGETCVLVAAPDTSVWVRVTKTNAQGSTSANSTPLVGFTCRSNRPSPSPVPTPTPEPNPPAAPEPIDPTPFPTRIPAVAHDDSPVGFIQRLYLALMGRVGEPTGVAHWERTLSQRGVHAVVRGFLISSEWDSLHGQVDNRTFVDLAYRTVFDRLVDPEGHAYWTDLLDRGVASREKVIMLLVESSEFHRRVSRYETTES